MPTSLIGPRNARESHAMAYLRPALDEAVSKGRPVSADWVPTSLSRASSSRSPSGSAATPAPAPPSLPTRFATG